MCASLTRPLLSVFFLHKWGNLFGIAIYARSHAHDLFKYILEITLTGEVEVIADLRQRFLGIGQEYAGFLNLYLIDELRNTDTGLCLKTLQEIRSA